MKQLLITIAGIAYNTLTLLTALLLFPFFLLNKRGRLHLKERYGYWDVQPMGDQEIIWIHGASAGEMKGLAPVVERLAAEFPQARLLFTAISDKGREAAVVMAGGKNSGGVFLLPFDSLSLYPEILKSGRIKFFINAETELWPALHQLLKRRQLPAYIVNARISDSTFKYYQFFKKFVEHLMQDVKRIFCSDRKSLERFAQLGIPANKLEVSGNSKYESRSQLPAAGELENLKKLLATGNVPLITLGSLRPGEEQVWMKVIQDPALSGSFKFIIVPRHLDKIGLFEEQLKKHRINFWTYGGSAGLMAEENKGDVVLINRFGLLAAIYSFSDIAFVGGSLVAIGGHNPLEPAEFGVPVLMGPHYQNVEEVVEEMKAADAISIIESAQDIAKILAEYLSDNRKLINAGRNAANLRNFYQGASDRVIHGICKNLP